MKHLPEEASGLSREEVSELIASMDFCGISEIAEGLRISEARTRKFIKSDYHPMPVHKVDGMIWARKHELEQWLRDGLITTEERRSLMYVYVVEAAEVDRVKIGSSQEPEQRVRDLQTQSPVQLRCRLTIKGADGEDERRLHRLFADERVQGEWFDVSGRIAKFIELMENTEPQKRARELRRFADDAEAA